MQNETLSRIQIKSYQKRKERAALQQQIKSIKIELEKQLEENEKVKQKLNSDALEADKLEEASKELGKYMSQYGQYMAHIWPLYGFKISIFQY